MLAIPGASVAGVEFGPGGVIVTLRRRSRRLTCPCGWSTPACYDRSQRAWRHLDLATSKLFLRAEIRRLSCRRCNRVRTETVPWARPNARHTRDFEDVVAYLAQRVDKTTVASLLRCSWEAVAAIVTRVVAEHIDATRLDDLFRIGVDDVSYRKGHRYLTMVADHDHDGRVVWVGEGRSAATLEAFFDELGEARTQQLQAISADMGAGYRKAISARAAHVDLCLDPFHVVKLANDAVDQVRRGVWNDLRRAGRSQPGPLGRSRKRRPTPATQFKRTRWAVLKDPDTLTEEQRQVLDRLRRDRSVLYRAWELKESLRDLYRLPDGHHPDAHLDTWLARACRSRIKEMVRLSRTIREHRAGVLAAVELGLSNSKLEGLASKVRLINHRGYGHHSAAAVIAMIYLCCGGITLKLPTES
jgi:transposase